MYVVAHGSGKSGFLPRLNLWYSDAAGDPPASFSAAAESRPVCTEVATQWEREPPKKKGFGGGKKVTRAGRGGTGWRSVRLEGLELVPWANAEARKSR